jgi:predicted amidophosphoribosyltransferase
VVGFGLLVYIAFRFGAKPKKQCPCCRAWVSKKAIVCKHCGRDIAKKG